MLLCCLEWTAEVGWFWFSTCVWNPCTLLLCRGELMLVRFGLFILLFTFYDVIHVFSWCVHMQTLSDTLHQCVCTRVCTVGARTNVCTFIQCQIWFLAFLTLALDKYKVIYVSNCVVICSASVCYFIIRL